MTLEQLVTDLATSQRLRDAGFPQDTAMVWFIYGESVQLLNREQVETFEKPNDEGVAAPTAEEILKELPLFLNKAINEQLCVTREENTPACNGWLVGWWSMDIHGVLGGIGEKSLSNVAAKSYLWWKKEVAG